MTCILFLFVKTFSRIESESSKVLYVFTYLHGIEIGYKMYFYKVNFLGEFSENGPKNNLKTDEENMGFCFIVIYSKDLETIFNTKCT